MDPQSFPDGLHPPTHPPTYPLKHLCPNHPLFSHRPLLRSIYPYSVHPSTYTLSIYLSIHCPSIYPTQCLSIYAIHFPFIYSDTVHPSIHTLSIYLPIHCSFIYPSLSPLSYTVLPSIQSTVYLTSYTPITPLTPTSISLLIYTTPPPPPPSVHPSFHVLTAHLSIC